MLSSLSLCLSLPLSCSFLPFLRTVVWVLCRFGYKTFPLNSMYCSEPFAFWIYTRYIYLVRFLSRGTCDTPDHKMSSWVGLYLCDRDGLAASWTLPASSISSAVVTTQNISRFSLCPLNVTWRTASPLIEKQWYRPMDLQFRFSMEKLLRLKYMCSYWNHSAIFFCACHQLFLLNVPQMQGTFVASIFVLVP